MASAQASDISAARYGYDFVVATTQASINATMEAFLATLQEPIVTAVFVASHDNPPIATPIPFADLMKLANNVDPFTIPDNTSTDDPRIKSLLNARFMGGFKARIGLPHVPDITKLPQMVLLGTSASQVTFNMYCSQFEIIQLTPGGGYSTEGSWFHQSQPASKPWSFTSQVNLQLVPVDRSAYNQLPPAVYQRTRGLDNAGSNFSVQQLLFDLTSAKLMTEPTINGVPSNSALWIALSTFFTGAYFQEMQADGQPILSCSVPVTNAQPSTMTLTSFEYEVNEYKDATKSMDPLDIQQLTTLGYLCAADGHHLPPATVFDWNWVDASQLGDHHGTIAINRKTLANYYAAQLEPFMKRVCVSVYTNVVYDAKKVETDFSWTLTGGQTPTITYPDPTDPTNKSPETVCRADYTSHYKDSAGDNDDLGVLELKTTYSLTVDFVGTTIVVTQHSVCYMYARSLQTDGSGNVVDSTIVDTYTLGIDTTGKLQVDGYTTKKTDNPTVPSVNWFLNFFTNFNDLSTEVSKTCQCVASDLQSVPISTIQDYVFPGGQTFIYKQVFFSDYQDLVAFINYVDPSAVQKAPVAKVQTTQPVKALPPAPSHVAQALHLPDMRNVPEIPGMLFPGNGLPGFPREKLAV
jgi:hypothetical protein